MSALLVVAPSGAAAVPIPPCQSAGPCVVVEVLEGTAQVGPLHYFSASDITGPDADVTGETYAVSGGGSGFVVDRGSSLTRLVASVVDVGQVRFAEVVGTDAYGRHLLSGAEAGPADTAGFEGGLVPAFYTSGSSVLSYVRPQRDAQDANGSGGPDQGPLNSAAGGALLVRVHLSGEILTGIGVTATPVDGSERSFALSTDQSGPGLTFDWVLPDASHSTEAAPVFTFAQNTTGGTFPVAVGVDRPDGSFGWGVGAVRAGPAPAPSPSATPSGGGGNGGASQGPTKNPQATQSADPNPNPTGSTGQPTPSPSPSASPTASASGSPEPTPTTPTETATPTPTPSAVGDQVSGILLAAQPLPVGGTVSADAPRPSPAARPIGDPPFGIPGVVLVVVGAVALLTLGSASESGLIRRRLKGWSRR